MALEIGRGITIGQGITITYWYPTAPTNTVLPVISGTAQVRITVNVNDGTWDPGIPPPITGYQYQWQANGIDIVGATTNTYSISYLYVGLPLRCRVTATNATGATSVFTVDTPNILPNTPLAPTSVVATTESLGTVKLTFVAPVDNGGANITSYTANSNAGSYTNTASTSPLYVYNVPVNTNLFFNVNATNSVGNGPAQASNSVTIIPNVSQIQVSNIATGTFNTVNISTDDKFVYGFASNGIYAYSRNLTTGTLSYINKYTTTNYNAGVITPNNNFLYALDTTNTITIFSRNTTTGVITSIGTQAIGTVNSSSQLVMSSDGKNLYISGATVTNSYAIKYDANLSTGALTNQVLYARTAPAASISRALAISPDDISLYLSRDDTSTNAILHYSRNTVDGNLTFVASQTATAPIVESLKVSPDNKSLYAGSLPSGVGNSYINQFTRNTSTGNITLTNTYTIPSGSGSPYTILIPTGNDVLFAPQRLYYRNTTTGNLTYSSNLSFATSEAVLTFDNKNIYGVSGNSIYAYQTYS